MSAEAKSEAKRKRLQRIHAKATLGHELTGPEALVLVREYDLVRREGARCLNALRGVHDEFMRHSEWEDGVCLYFRGMSVSEMQLPIAAAATVLADFPVKK